MGTPQSHDAAISHSELPKRLRELADAIGLEATLQLVQAHGGTRIYVPEKASAEHWIAQLIGTAAMQKLVQHYCHEFLELDKASAALRAVRDGQICALKKSGSTTVSIALKFGLTQRQVFNILAKAGAKRANIRSPSTADSEVIQTAQLKPFRRS